VQSGGRAVALHVGTRRPSLPVVNADGSGGGPRSLPLILARELAANLATPMFLIDAEGTLAFCNEAAELMLGRSFGELGVATASELGSLLHLTGLDGEPLRRRDSPPGRALLQREPAHQRLLISALDGVQREVEVTAYPLFGRDEEMHGVLVVFWEAR
jgi:PAS domain-containing protein